MIDLKKKTWTVVVEALNKKFLTSRSVLQVQEKWRSLKKKAKKDSAKQRSETFKTGGGTSEMTEIPSESADVLDMIKQQIDPLSNPFDSDRMADNNDCTTQTIVLSDSEINVENMPPQVKKSKKSILDAATDLHELKLIEHRLRVKQMTEEHDLKIQFMKEEHEAKMRQYGRNPLSELDLNSYQANGFLYKKDNF